MAQQENYLKQDLREQYANHLIKIGGRMEAIKPEDLHTMIGKEEMHFMVRC